VPSALPRISIARVSPSAARFNRARRLRLALRVDGGRVLGVVATLRRGRTTIARGRAARLGGRGRVTLRALKGRRLKPGRHTVVVRARDEQGRTVGARRTLRVR
jgi:hypothetical protein